jgi:hypothetical protein
MRPKARLYYRTSDSEDIRNTVFFASVRDVPRAVQDDEAIYSHSRQVKMQL